MHYKFETKDEHEAHTAINASAAFCLLNEIDMELRSLLKYGTSNEFIKDITRDELAERIRTMINSSIEYQQWQEE